MQTSANLVKSLAKTENDYFYDSLNRNDMLSAIKQIEYEFEKSIISFSKEKDSKNVVSLFLMLERLKKYLVYENFVLNLVETELGTLTSNFELLSLSGLGDNELEKNGSNDDIKLGLIHSNSSNKKSNESGIFTQRIKNKRANYPKKISRVLKNWLKENMNNPYPSESEKLMLMDLTGLDATQINNWFINARRRILPYMKSKYIKYE